MRYYAHESAVIDPGAEIGAGCRIWHFVHVSGSAVIAENVSLGQGVFVGEDVRIGAKCKIQNHVSLYQGVTLEPGVFCGPSVVFTNVINPRAQVDRKAEFRSTPVGEGATLGANSTIVCGNRIGRYAFVAAGAVVTRAVPDYALVAGVPARHQGWMSEHGQRLDLPLSGKGRAACPESGEQYQLHDDVVSRVATA